MILKLLCVVVEIGRFVKYDSRRLLIYTISGIMVITVLQYDAGGALFDIDLTTMPKAIFKQIKEALILVRYMAKAQLISNFKASFMSMLNFD